MQRKEEYTIRKTWMPPTTLELPQPPKGYKYHWLRTENKKFRKKIKFKPVHYKNLKDPNTYPTINVGRWGKCIGIQGLLLIKIKIKKRKHHEKNKKEQRIRT
jgi:hypothetical protein